MFRGVDHEATDQFLRGVVVLCLSTPMKFEALTLNLTGTMKKG